MAVLKLSPFGGMIPARDDRHLPDQAASFAEEVVLGDGTLRGHHPEVAVRTLSNNSAVAVFRIPHDELSSDVGATSTWLEFLDENTNVVRSPVNGDTHKRYYWASPSDVPRYNPYLRVLSSAAPLKLGVPAPSEPPTLEITGGTAGTETVPEITETRAYLYTYVTEYGEEGPPSDPVLATGISDATWTLSMGSPTSDQNTDRRITHRRIYRTVTAVGGSTTYFFVFEQDIATTFYGDELTNDVVTANDQLQSLNWTEPPHLRGIVQMPNGILAGWEGSTVYFSEPFRPHAWPVAYSLSMDFPIVGLGVFNQSLIVCTTGFPAVISGTHPAQMSQANFPLLEPCLSRGSIVSTSTGVMYASPNGLVTASTGGVKNMTENLIDRETWITEVEPDTIRGVFYDGEYIGFIDVPRTGGGLNFTIGELPTGFIWGNDTKATKNIFLDFWSGKVLRIHSGQVWQYSPVTTVGMLPYTWKSKEFQSPRPVNFSAMKVMFEVPDGSPTLDTENTALSQTLSATQYALIKAYVDGRHVYTRELRESGVVFLLPSGFKGTVWQFQVTARVIIHSIEIATSVKELRQV